MDTKCLAWTSSCVVMVRDGFWFGRRCGPIPAECLKLQLSGLEVDFGQIGWSKGSPYHRAGAQTQLWFFKFD